MTWLITLVIIIKKNKKNYSLQLYDSIAQYNVYITLNNSIRGTGCLVKIVQVIYVVITALWNYQIFAIHYYTWIYRPIKYLWWTYRVLNTYYIYIYFYFYLSNIIFYFLYYGTAENPKARRACNSLIQSSLILRTYPKTTLFIYRILQPYTLYIFKFIWNEHHT